MSGSVSVAKDTLPLINTLNTSFAEYLAFSLIFLFFYRCPTILLCPRAPAVRNLGARAPASSMVPAHGGQPRQCILHKWTARFVSDSSVSCSFSILFWDAPRNSICVWIKTKVAVLRCGIPVYASPSLIVSPSRVQEERSVGSVCRLCPVAMG